jgi:hypothetical protein
MKDSFVYGEFDSVYGQDTIYILTLPRMIWRKTKFLNDVRRKQMVCVWAGFNDQAIFVGGIDPDQNKNDAQNWNGTLDPWEQGLGVFSMTDLRMKDRYDPDAPPYAAPPIIKALYDNG